MGYVDPVAGMLKTPGVRILLALSALLVLAILGLVLTAGQTTASPDGKIIIRGADSSSHLTLTVSKSRILVSGNLASSGQTGCRHSDGGLACPVAGVSEAKVVMGPENDKVEVDEKLPVPLTVHLGNGSDKFIGNNERDTCYSEGSRRNRCIGGGGKDVCITGPQNSDCVGGPGDDLCIHSTGSDGCWGDAGNDVCHMGPGKDGCHGGPGNDRLFGGADPDQLYGGPGNDYCDGGQGRGKSHTCERGPGH
jgi:Ca2+-binding RTX toxin-like protein